MAHSKPGDNKKARSRRYNGFMNEARTAEMLKHQNIIEIYGVGDKNGVTYMAMELVTGQRSLSQHCNSDNLLRVEEMLRLSSSAPLPSNLCTAIASSIVTRNRRPDATRITTVYVTGAGVGKQLLRQIGYLYSGGSVV